MAQGAPMFHLSVSIFRFPFPWLSYISSFSLFGCITVVLTGYFRAVDAKVINNNCVRPFWGPLVTRREVQYGTPVLLASGIPRPGLPVALLL